MRCGIQFLEIKPRHVAEKSSWFAVSLRRNECFWGVDVYVRLKVDSKDRQHKSTMCLRRRIAYGKNRGALNAYTRGRY